MRILKNLGLRMLALEFKKIITSPSKTFLLLAAMFCFGIFLGSFAVEMQTEVFVSLLSFGIILTLFSSNQTHRIAFFAITLFIFGLFRYTQSEIPKNIPTVRDYAGSMIRIEGDVAGEPTIGKSQQVTIRNVRVADTPVFGNVLVSVPLENPLLTKEGAGGGLISYGDHLVFACSMQIPRPFSGFAYDRYLHAKGTLALCRFPHDLDRTPSKTGSFIGSILSFKQQVILTMKKVLPDPHASFLFGLIFGGSTGLEKEVQTDFAKTGMTHILAASGFNVSLFTFVFFGWVILFLGKARGAIVTALLLVAYVVIAGMGAAVIRAAIFGGMILFGSVIGRRAHMVNVLLCTASIMLLFNPRLLLDDVGFQLSFVAFAAIVFVAPKLEERFLFVPEQLGIRDALAGSLSAIVLTLPIILWQFGSVSLVAPFANVFVLPLVPFLMFYTIALLPIAWLSITLGQFFALPALWGSQYILSIISIFASLPFASVSVPFAQTLAILVAIFLVIGSVATFWKS